jgi:hypothetical protein
VQSKDTTFLALAIQVCSQGRANAGFVRKGSQGTATAEHPCAAVALTVVWGSAGTHVESFAVQPGMVRTDLWNPEKTDVKGKFAAFITGARARGL